MNKKSFSKLSLSEKGKKALLEGKFIASREYYNQRLVLYDLGEFFAEVWYNPENNTIHRIESLSQDSEHIDLYIESNKGK